MSGLDTDRDAQLRQLAVDAQLAREAATQALFDGRELAARLKEVERRLATDPLLADRAIDRMFEITERMSQINEHMKWLEGRLAASEERVQVMKASTSWRITGPLRWIVALLRGELRAHRHAGEAPRPPASPASRAPIQPATTHAPAPPPLTSSAQRVRDVIVHVTKDEAPAKKDS